MKLSAKYFYHVLCEDVQTRCFICAVLNNQGIIKHKITVDMSPSGEKCGSAFVRQNYKIQLRLIQSKKFINNVLIVCCDADDNSIDERIRFIEEYPDGTIVDRKKESVIIWIPKREIENWIHFWREGTDEEHKFVHAGRKLESCKDEAEKMSKYLSGQKPKLEVLSSIEHAKKEFDRVCMMQKKNDTN